MNFKQYLSAFDGNKQGLNESATKIWAELNMHGPSENQWLGNNFSKTFFTKSIAATKRIMRQLTGHEFGRYIIPLNSSGELALNLDNQKQESRTIIKNAIPELVNTHKIFDHISLFVGEYFTYKLENLLDSDSVLIKHSAKHTTGQSTLNYEKLSFIIKAENDISDENVQELTRQTNRVISRFNGSSVIHSAGNTISVLVSFDAVPLHKISHFSNLVDSTPDDILAKGSLGTDMPTSIKTQEIVARDHTTLNRFINNLIEAIFNDLDVDSDTKDIVEAAAINLRRASAERRQHNDNVNIGSYVTKLADFKSVYDLEEPIRIRAKIAELEAIQNPAPNIQNQLNGLRIKLERLSGNTANQEITLDNSSNYDLVISNLDIDIISMSTNKSWSSCQNTYNASTHNDFIDKLYNKIESSTNKAQYIRDLMNDPAAESFYRNYAANIRNLESKITQYIDSNSVGVHKDILRDLFNVDGTASTYASSHSRARKNAHGAVMVLYIVPHAKKYIGGTRLSDTDYNKKVIQSIKGAKGRITLLPAVVDSKNRITFVPGTYAHNSVNITSLAYGATNINTVLSSNELRALKSAMENFYTGQGLQVSDVNDNAYSMPVVTFYYDQGTINSKSSYSNIDQIS